MNFSAAVSTFDGILTEGSLIERFNRDHPEMLHPEILSSGFIYAPQSRQLLGEMYRRYLQIANEWQLPMLVFASTWRASPDRLARVGLDQRDVNGDNVRFLREIMDELEDPGSPHYMGGLMACRGDAYRGDQSLSRSEARDWHARQADNLAAAGVDFLQAATLPALPEAMGMAEAMGATGLPVVLGFVVHPRGTLLDGTPLSQAIKTIDQQCDPAPLFYMLNCIHPSVAGEAVERELLEHPRQAERLWGLQANTSQLRPDELDGLDHLDPADPSTLMLDLKRRFNWRILGGCCGTDERHIEMLARGIVSGT